MGIVKTRAGLKESLEEMILHVLDVIYEADEEPEKPADGEEDGDGAPVGMNRLEKIAMERGLSEEEVMKYWEAAKKKAVTWAEEKQADPETMMGYALKVLREMLPPKPEPEPEEIDAPPEEAGPVTKGGEDKEKSAKEKTDDAVSKAEKDKGVEKKDDKKEEKPEDKKEDKPKEKDDKKKEEIKERLDFEPSEKTDNVLMVNPKSGEEVVVDKSAIEKQKKLGYQLSEAAKPKVSVYDNGGETMDRYTVIIGDDAYGMGENPRGFNQYVGDAKSLSKAFLRTQKKVDVKKLNRDVQNAIKARMSESVNEAMGNVMGKKEMAALKKAGINAAKLTPKQRDAAVKKLKKARGSKKGSMLGGLGALFTGIGVGVIAGKALDSAFSLFKHG